MKKISQNSIARSTAASAELPETVKAPKAANIILPQAIGATIGQTGHRNINIACSPPFSRSIRLSW